MEKYYQIIKTELDGPAWALPADLLSLLMLEEGDMVNIRFGSANTWAIIYLLDSQDGNSKQMGFSSNILENLAIPEKISVLIKPEGNKKFHLGPVIGILTFQSIVTEKKFHYYNRSAIINQNNGLLYVFSGKDIDIGSQTIQGYYYDCDDGSWKHQRFPFPDAVIDRCYPNNYSYHELLEQGNGCKIFNRKNRIDKMEFFNALKCDSFLKNHVPDTKLIKDISDLEYFLGKYNELYLKPINSMKGFGIIYVKYFGGDLFEYSCMENGEVYSELVNITNIFEVLEKVAKSKRQYIMQQVVPSIEYKKGSFSIRVWAIKDGNGNWLVPGMYARGTCGNGFLTNISVGSKEIPLKNLFKVISSRLLLTKDQLTILLEDFTLKAAKVLDHEYGPLGIIGLDFMIDKEGKLWLIEANGNPGKSAVIRQNEFFSWSTRVYQYPLEYATYLAGFAKANKLKHETASDDVQIEKNIGNEEQLIKGAVVQETNTIEEAELVNNIPEQVDTEKDNDCLTTSDSTTLESLENTAEISANVVGNEEQFIQTQVVVATKTLREVVRLEIIAPDGVGIEKHTDNLTVPVLLELCGKPVIKSKIMNDTLTYQGYIPVKLRVGINTFDSSLDEAEEVVQEVLVPFQLKSEIKGIKSEDNLQEEINIEEISVMGIQRVENGEANPKLILKISLQVDIVILREYIVAVPARIIQPTKH